MLKNLPKYTHNQTDHLHKKEYPLHKSFLTGPHVNAGPFPVTKLDQAASLVC